MRLLTTVIPLDANTNQFKNNSSYLVVNDIRYLEHNKNKKQSKCLFPLFEVHITLGFKSEVSAVVLLDNRVSRWLVESAKTRKHESNRFFHRIFSDL